MTNTVGEVTRTAAEYQQLAWWQISRKNKNTAQHLVLDLVCDWGMALSSFISSVGKRCEQVFDGCKSKPCRNGGTCAVASNTAHGFICRCPPVSEPAHHISSK